jgi:hypothetical protein
LFGASSLAAEPSGTPSELSDVGSDASFMPDAAFMSGAAADRSGGGGGSSLAAATGGSTRVGCRTGGDALERPNVVGATSANWGRGGGADVPDGGGASLKAGRLGAPPVCRGVLAAADAFGPGAARSPAPPGSEALRESAGRGAPPSVPGADACPS